MKATLTIYPARPEDRLEWPGVDVLEVEYEPDDPTDESGGWNAVVTVEGDLDAIVAAKVEEGIDLEIDEAEGTGRCINCGDPLTSEGFCERCQPEECRIAVAADQS